MADETNLFAEWADDYTPADTGDAWEQYRDDVLKIAGEEGVDPDLVTAIMRAESGGKQLARSSKGASGLMQLMPPTAKEMGVTDLNDPLQNIRGGTKYIKKMLDRHDGDVQLALAAYNAGPGNVRKYGGIPPFKETQNYVKKVGSFYKQVKGTQDRGFKAIEDKSNDNLFKAFSELNPGTGMPQGSFEQPPLGRH